MNGLPAGNRRHWWRRHGDRAAQLPIARHAPLRAQTRCSVAARIWHWCRSACWSPWPGRAAGTAGNWWCMCGAPPSSRPPCWRWSRVAARSPPKGWPSASASGHTLPSRTRRSRPWNTQKFTTKSMNGKHRPLLTDASVDFFEIAGWTSRL